MVQGYTVSEKSIQEDYARIIGLLEQKRLKEAQEQLATLQQSCDDWQLRNRLEQVSTSYTYMLTYMRQGIVDPGRKQMLARLLTETREIADLTRLALLDRVSNHYYHLLRRQQGAQLKACRLDTLLKILEAFPDEAAVCRLMPGHQGLMEILERHDKSLQDLFLSTWCNPSWSNEELEQAKRYHTSELLPLNDLCLFVSAVTLSLIECFDPRKFLWLQTASSHKEAMVNQRAFIGLAMVMLTHPSCLQRYPDLLRNFELFNDSGHFVKLLNQTVLYLLRSQETEKVNKKMREEILPEVSKQAGIILNLHKFDSEESGEENDLNPDWEQAFEQSGLNDKIREMGELQMQGADVYMSTFSQLKGYPFFKELHNWLYPFDRLHPEVVKSLGSETGNNKDRLATIILRSGFFCNSDKYSMAFMMSMLPESQRTLMLSQLTEQGMDEWADEEKFASLKAHSERPDVICTQYVHDLYRFFKLNMRRTEFHDIFAHEIDLRLVDGLRDFVCSDPESLRTLANYLFKQEHYAEAESYYTDAERQLPEKDAELYQKLGYCHQKENHFEAAIGCYLKADILKPDNLWTIRHLATCYRRTGNYDTALEYYQRAEAVQPENQNLLLQTGTCLVKLQRYDEAMQYFFKMDFMKENNLKAWRAIGWCSFSSRKYEQALKYYEKLTACDSPTADDYFNAGHSAWCLGDIPKAVSFYTQAAALCPDHNAFLEMFQLDMEELKQHGFSEADVALIADMA